MMNTITSASPTHGWLARSPRPTSGVKYELDLSDPIDAADAYRWVKVKLSGDAAPDAAQVRDVGRLGTRISQDPNDGYRSAAELANLPDAVDADYIEQPAPSDAPGPGSGAIPALIDEGLPDPGRLDEFTGRDGVVVKTCRGQTSALLTYSLARHRADFGVAAPGRLPRRRPHYLWDDRRSGVAICRARARLDVFSENRDER
ncbi:hypothetical protein ABH935_009203 [Catenulispora sp. GAS73]|uniref:hypothetical protein n=1 Tax=Catenulispora sp. GAS73 TaxID=3156269 RepID=UPI00351175E8